MHRVLILVIAGLWNMGVVEGQVKQFNRENADSVMASYLKRINYWSSVSRYAPEESDSLIDLNRRLMDFLKNLGGDANTISARFPTAEGKGLMSMASDDGKLRLYAWDTWTGNSMHYFDAIAQYNAGDKIGVRILNDVSDTTKAPDPGSYFTEINTLRTNEGKTVYLVTDCTIASKSEKANGIRAYTIENGAFKNVDFFKTKKLLTNYIDFVYNLSYDSLTSFIVSIHFSNDKKHLYIPVVLKNGRLSRNYWLYVFKGDKFVFRKRVKATV